MADMPGDRAEAKALQARIDADLASDPAAGAVCSASKQTFDSGIVVGPDWELAITHPPTLLTLVGLALVGGIGIGVSIAALRRNRPPCKARTTKIGTQ